MLAQLGKRGKSVSVRQVQVKQNEANIRMLGDELYCLVAIRGFQHGRVALDLPEDAAQCLANQDVTVDHKNFHKCDLSVRPSASILESQDRSIPPIAAAANRKVVGLKGYFPAVLLVMRFHRHPSG